MEYIEELRLLSDVLRKSNRITSFDHEDEKEADTIAHALLDIRGSFDKIYEEYLPALKAQGISSKNVNNIMLDIGWELEHILYHIQDCKYYSYLPSHRKNFDSSQIQTTR